MTYQIRPLFQQILRTLGKPLAHYDHNFPIQIKTLTAVNRLQPHPHTLIGMAILPGTLNVLIRPKVFIVETTALVEDIPLTTYSVVVMDAAGDLRLIEDLTVTSDDLPGLDRFILQAGDLLDEQAGRTHQPATTEKVTHILLHNAATRIAHTCSTKRISLIIYILSVLQDHIEPHAYGDMLAELILAIEVWELEGTW